ncbi:MAG TPA: hypothetical protein VGK22_05775, partial [Candidatus Angelobacter sp.]
MPLILWRRALVSLVAVFTILTILPVTIILAEQPASIPQTLPQDSPSSTMLRANTRLVVVDVVATDSKGNPIPDLKVEDFTVLEDGKPQKISAFSFKQNSKATP